MTTSWDEEDELCCPSCGVPWYDGKSGTKKSTLPTGSWKACVLANMNATKRASLAHIKDILDYECTKPTVVVECRNCHICRRPRMRERWDASF